MFSMRAFALLIAGLCIALSPSTASAVFILDSYTAPPAGHSATSTGALDSSALTGLAGIAFIDNREIGVTRTAGTGTRTATIDAAVSPGFVAVSNDVGVSSMAYVAYDYSGVPLDFTGVSTATLSSANVDIAGATATITFFNGMSTATTATMPFSVFPVTADINFDLTGLSAAVMSNVTGIRIDINSPNERSDLVFDSFSVDAPPERIPGVPEPATMVTFGLIGLVGGVVARRKMKAQVA